VIGLQLKIILLTALGFIFLGLGAIGLLLPVWPTTPFVLISVACFSSSPHIKARILKIPFVGEHVENYRLRNGLSRKTFWLSMVWLWGMLSLSMVLIGSLWAASLLFLVGTFVSIHILYMSKAKSKKKGGTG
jgi:uncharacterized membrane protein YbaN (DUF454 family)